MHIMQHAGAHTHDLQVSALCVVLHQLNTWFPPPTYQEDEPGTRVISGDELAELIRHLKLKCAALRTAGPCLHVADRRAAPAAELA